MSKFKSLNSSEANMQSVHDNAEDARTTMTEQVLERKEFAFNKYNVDGEKRRSEGEKH